MKKKSFLSLSITLAITLVLSFSFSHNLFAKSLKQISEENLKILKKSFPFYNKMNGYLQLEWNTYHYVEDLTEEEEYQYEILNTIQAYFAKDKNNDYRFFLNLDSQNEKVKYSLLYLKNEGWYKFRSSDKVKKLTRKRMSSLIKTSIGIPTHFLYQNENLLEQFNFSLVNNKEKKTYEITIKDKKEVNNNYTKIYLDNKNYRYQKIEYVKHNVLTKTSELFYNENNKGKLFDYIKQYDNLSGKIIAKIEVKQAFFDNPRSLPQNIFSYDRFSNLYKDKD